MVALGFDYSEAHFIKAHDKSLLKLNQGGVCINRKQTLNWLTQPLLIGHSNHMNFYWQIVPRGYSYHFHLTSAQCCAGARGGLFRCLQILSEHWERREADTRLWLGSEDHNSSHPGKSSLTTLLFTMPPTSHNLSWPRYKQVILSSAASDR